MSYNLNGHQKGLGLAYGDQRSALRKIQCLTPNAPDCVKCTLKTKPLATS